MNNDINALSQKVINESDIVKIISEYIPLEKKGNDYKGICPFHNDSNPSLSVSPVKKLFKCFSCNTAGNVISFVSKIENISYFEALKKVANMSNIKLDIKEDPNLAKRNKYFQILNDASKFYEFYLNNTVEGEEALEYLHNRNLNDDVIKRFKIGLSSQNSDVICKTFLETDKYLPLDLIETALVTKEDNKYHDIFHGRIMFPITDLKGNICGFSGRIYNKKSNSKYINTKESEIFKKKEILYNYHEAFNDIKKLDHVYIFEGFMDVIACYRANINNAIATMGTSLTINQIEIITKITKNITLCYDGDDAGINATKRAIGLFLKKGINCNVVTLPAGLDPDDYINKYGKDEFTKLMNNHVNFVDYLYYIAKRKLNENDPQSMIVFQNEISSIVNSLNNPSIKKYLIDKISIDLNIKDFNFTNANNLVTNDNQPKSTPNLVNKPKRNIQIKNYEEAERGIIYLSFYSKEACMKVQKRIGFDNFYNRINRDILLELYNYYELSKTMNKNEFFKLLNDLQIEQLNTIINTCHFYNINCLDDFIEYVLKSDQIKLDINLRNKIKMKIENNSDYQQELMGLVDNKKKLIKIKKK